jgi:hypothetical protein
MSGEGASLAMPIILPATRPLPAAQRVERGAWFADKLREARALGPADDAEEWPWTFSLVELKARLRG